MVELLRFAFLVALLLGISACGTLMPANDPPPYFRGVGGNSAA